MTNRFRFAAPLSLLAAVPGAATALDDQTTVLALGQEGSALFVLAAPGQDAPMALPLTADGGPVTLDAIAYRPQTGQLYGYDDEADTVFEIDTESGVATAVVSQAALTNSTNVGLDFNNVLDAARIVTAERENRVFFPADATLTTKPLDLFYADADRFAGEVPNVVANAYTNAVPGPETTAQYVIDSTRNTLAILANNAGELATVGVLTVDGAPLDITEHAGFDILSAAEGDNTAYALLTERITGTQRLYEVALSADAAGEIALKAVHDLRSDFGTLAGLAVIPGEGAAPIR